MKENEINTELSLLGGPLHRLGCRMGLVRGGTNTIRLGLLLGLSAWAVLALLAFVQGRGDRLLSITAIGAHVRLLIAIPLFFVCEMMVVPRMAEFVRNIVRSGVVRSNDLPVLNSELARIGRWKDSWIPEAICLLMAALLPLAAAQMHPGGVTAAYDPIRFVAGKSLTGLWYWFVCLPLFRFLMLRWLWHLGVWWYFLWRVARLELNLVPTHPDSAAGLGYLEVVQTHFMPLVLALSAVQSASFAEELYVGTMTFESIYPTLAVSLVLLAAFFLGPLFIFTPRLWACRVKGLSDYTGFAARYVNGFDRKWLGSDTSADEPLLGTPDLQSLADLANSINVVRNMRWVPLSRHLAVELAIAALLPILPLFLLKYPVAELAEKFFTRLTGL